MATQLISVVKVGGSAGEWVGEQLGRWASAGRPGTGADWAADQWPLDARRAADQLADRLRANRTTPPVVYFAEWVDLWSMGDTLARWLTPHPGQSPAHLPGERYDELFGYTLPDGGLLARHLAEAGPPPSAEDGWLVRRLHEATVSWAGLVDRATLVVLRRVTAPTVTDKELKGSLAGVPAFLTDPLAIGPAGRGR